LQNAVIIDRVMVENNEKVAHLHIDFFKISNITSGLNISFTIKRDVAKVTVAVAIDLQAGPNDKRYKTEFLRLSVDLEKIMKGLKGNILTRDIAKSFAKSLDFKLEFPLKAVSCSI